MKETNPDCPFCQSESVLFWKAVNVWRCPECQLLFKRPTPSPEDLRQLYQTSWARPDTHVSQVGATDLNLARQYVGRLTQTLDVNDLKGANILEFGSGSGAMLAALVEAGARVVGVEPFGYEEVRRKGHQVYRSLDELPAGIRFDGIVTMEVVEHLLAPWETLSRLRGLLKDGAWLLVTTPNPRGLNARLTQSRWRELQKPGHLMFFSPRSMEKMLVQCGYPACQRLRWYIEYSPNRLKRLMQNVLQFLRLDGSLLCLVWKR